MLSFLFCLFIEKLFNISLKKNIRRLSIIKNIYANKFLFVELI
ncbi:hypothetical protein SDC9_47493 [bioreactor metagenome]|uniref:Uncharacterized protein n=1 Tax=bioreactor metagenome TaxID=1076179 RepID=A0A644WG16_9ZZZZ